MKKILTVILDGFGMRNEKHGNAVLNSNINNFISLWENYPHCLLKASEEAVGLEEHQMGNSEVGHTTIGAGRLIKQPLKEVTDFLDEEYKKNVVYQELINYLKENNRPLHIIGLTSDGGIHSHIRLMLKMIDNLYNSGIKKIYYHAITDGRDTKTEVSYNYIKEVDDKLTGYHIGKVESVCGRYYAMDRDKKWNRTQKYYDLLVGNYSIPVSDFSKAINACYKKNITDEFLPPLSLNDNVKISDGDAVLWMNYRPDRAKQILNALTDPDFTAFSTIKMPHLQTVTLYPIKEAINSKSLLSNQEISNPLGVYLSKLGLSQARIAETEKYAHVTYFFDGGKELQLEKCDRFLIPSPKVATYDLKPEMSAAEVTKQAIKCMEDDYDFIFMNYANPDMVGHTGNYEATIKALEAVDICLGKLKEIADANFYKMIILADHGNADLMLDENNNPITTHSLSLVPFILTDKKIKLENGDLTQVACTILEYMDIARPKEMQNTNSLIVKE